MSLGRKLSRLTGAGPGSRPKADAPREPEAAPKADDGDAGDGWDAFRAALRSKSDRDGRRVERAREAMVLPGEREETEHGPLRRIVTRSPLDVAHGGVPHRALLDVDPAGVARFALDPSLSGVDPSRMVFLDTETTGLAGGAGTVPFLVGVGRIEAGSWVVEQWFLERFGQEAPILRRLAEVLEGASALVTYNGKSFDWPLLRARYVLHRLPIPSVPVHLDLVHGARRLLKDRLASVRLVDVERELLGFEREDDVDGSEIPGIYLEFQRSGAHPDLPRIFRHHALDLVAMPAALVRFSAMLVGDARPDHALDRLACARVIARAGATDDGLGLVRDLLVGAEASGTGWAAELLLAREARRAGDHDSARRSLERALALAAHADEARVAALELAKLLEHQLRDVEAALRVAESIASMQPHEESARRRVARLERKRIGRRTRRTPEAPAADPGPGELVADALAEGARRE